jgi:hypothetical protein
VEVDGIVPPTGVSGTLTNGGISAYRVPAAAWTNLGTSGLKYRVQAEETLMLSDYAARQDLPLIPKDERIMQVFQGAGPASTWRLELPKGINDFDYGALTDVRLTFYYRARYDPDLRHTVLSQLASRPGFNARQVGIPLRWVYPDAFFRFQNTGQLAITLRPSDLPKNQQRPVLTDIGVLVITDGSVPAKGMTLGLATPTHAAVNGTTDGDGAISSASGPWKPLAAGSVLGDYSITLDGTVNPSLVQGGTLALAPIVNLSLILGYSFTPRA